MHKTFRLGPLTSAETIRLIRQRGEGGYGVGGEVDYIGLLIATLSPPE